MRCSIFSTVINRVINYILSPYIDTVLNSVFFPVTIQILGRWTSDAFRRYLHLSDDFILQAFNRMSAIRTLSRCWDTELASSEARL